VLDGFIQNPLILDYRKGLPGTGIVLSAFQITDDWVGLQFVYKTGYMTLAKAPVEYDQQADIFGIVALGKIPDLFHQVEKYVLPGRILQEPGGLMVIDNL
jgi:hypothetical protein